MTNVQLLKNLLLTVVLATPSLLADEPESRFNLKQQTLGGTQFWTDQLIVQDWRIQRNVLTNGYRLLDDRDVRHAWGTSEQCRAAFDRIRNERQLKPATGKVVIALHGLVT